MAETKISVSSHAVPLMGHIGNRVVEVVTYSALSGTSVSSNLIDEALGGMGIKARNVYNYARDYYPLGLPTGNNSETYMPIIPLRHDNVDLTSIDDELYRTSKTLLKKMSINIDDLATRINDNPDIDQIDHAWVMFGVSVNTEDIPGLRYLNNYFHHMYEVQEYNEAIFAAALAAGELPPYTVFLLDKNNPTQGELSGGVTFLEHGLDVAITFNYISSEVTNEVIGKIGFTTKEIIFEYEELLPGEGGGDGSFHHTQTDGPDGGKSLVLCPGQAMGFTDCHVGTVSIPYHGYDDGRETYWNMASGIAGDIVCSHDGVTYTYPCHSTFVYGECPDTGVGSPTGDLDTIEEDRDRSVLILRTQISKTQVRTVKVRGLKHINYVYKDKMYVTTLISYEEDPENGNLIIPIQYDIANMLPLLARNDLYTNSLHLIVNAIEKTKVKWYASKVFRIVIMFAAVVVIAFTGQAWTASIAQTLQQGAVAIMWALAKAVAISMALSVAFKYAVEIIGPEAGIIIAAVIIIASIVSYRFDLVKFGTGLLPTAEQFLMAGQALLDASNKHIKGQIKDLYEEAEEFAEDAKAKMELLEDAQDLLEMSNNYNPLNFVRKQTQVEVPHESPGAFYNRTVHTGNIGVLALDVIGVYHNIMLKLPEADYT